MSQRSLIDELEDAISSAAPEKRLAALERTADLFVAGAGHYSDDQVALFDDVFLRLAAEIEVQARSKLARRLAPIANAPAKTIRHLANDDEVSVAAPVLGRSPRLADADLVATASSKSQGHLYAIAQRASLSEAVTDVLVERGDPRVVRSVAGNAGARFSQAGFGKLVARAHADKILARVVGTRRDIPRHHFLKLLQTASASVREKLIAANPLAARDVEDVVAEVAGAMRHDARNGSQDHAAAKAEIESLHRSGRLDEVDIHAAARSRKFDQTAVALSLLARVPVDVAERALLEEQPDMLLILAKAAGCSWTTAQSLLLVQAGDRALSAQSLHKALEEFERLQLATARSAVEYYRKHGLERAGAAGQEAGGVAAPAA